MSGLHKRVVDALERAATDAFATSSTRECARAALASIRDHAIVPVAAPEDAGRVELPIQKENIHE